MSYLLFTGKYTSDLIALGYHDADERIDEIEDYLFSDTDGKSAAWPRNGRARETDVPVRRNGALAR